MQERGRYKKEERRKRVKQRERKKHPGSVSGSTTHLSLKHMGSLQCSEGCQRRRRSGGRGKSRKAREMTGE